MTRVATFEVHHTRFIDRNGRPTQALPACAKDRAALVTMYRAMVLTRTFDTKAVALQRTGRLGTYASSLGQEAIAVGVGVAMTPEDVLLPYAREHGTQLLRGVTLRELFLFWGGDERGNDFATPRQDFPVSVPIATHVPHAAGVAMAFKLRGERRAAVCLFGDGATSKGDFYEGLNLAGVWGVPAVFVISNNAWAISMPREAQTAAETLAQKAIAAGVSCEQIDGNDVVAVRVAVEVSLARRLIPNTGGGRQRPHYVVHDLMTKDPVAVRPTADLQTARARRQRGRGRRDGKHPLYPRRRGRTAARGVVDGCLADARPSCGRPRHRRQPGGPDSGGNADGP